ncbi:MAG: transglycosylase domain-containing protein [Kineosporiaceae bacterium]
MTIRSDRPYARRANRGPDGSGAGRAKKNWINYPRAKSRIRWMRWLPSLRLMLLSTFLVVGGVVAAVSVAYARTPLPKIADITKSEVTIVYWSDGSEMTRFQEQNRMILPNGKIPQVMKDATIGSEDRTFETNPGISARGIARAAYNNARGRPLQGGSTLTQQYVKNVLLNTQERTRSRKIKEFFIAVKIGRKMEKDEIISQYLNTIYFGRNSYGIEAASQTYFGHPASKLTLSEAAYLAGIINGPELYDPLDGPQSKARAVVRWNHALDGMIAIGKLTEAERSKLTFPTIIPVKISASNAGQVGYLRKNLRKALLTLTVNGEKLTDKDIDRGGLRIHSTYDKRLVALAASTVKDELPKDVQPTLRVGLTTIDPRNGAVLATYGGPGFDAQHQLDNSTQASGQVGSTFKPWGLIAALENKVSLRTKFNGNSPQYFEGTKVKNFGPRPWGDIDLIKATANSVNTVYVALNVQVGADKAHQVAVRAGLPDRDIKDNITNVLGDTSKTTLEVASAYSTIAAQGVRHPAYFVQRIDGSDGKVLYEHKDPGRREFAADVMADATYAMQQVVQSGSGSRARALGRPVAGKTGTSSSNRSAWFSAFTPQLVTTVALFDADKAGNPVTVVVDGAEQTGAGYPSQIWTAYMKEALGKARKMDFPEPAWVGEEIKPSGSESPTGTPSITDSGTPTASITGGATPSDTPTGEPSVTDEPTPTDEPSVTDEPTPTDEPSETARPTTTRARPTTSRAAPSASASP